MWLTKAVHIVERGALCSVQWQAGACVAGGLVATVARCIWGRACVDAQLRVTVDPETGGYFIHADEQPPSSIRGWMHIVDEAPAGDGAAAGDL